MRVKILIFPAALALSIAIVIAYVWPEKEAVREVRKALDGSRNTLQSIKEKKNNIDSLKKSLEQNQDKKSLVSSYLPSGQSEEEIINKLNWLAADSSVTLNTLSPEKETAKASAAGGEETAELSSKEVLFSSSQEPAAVGSRPRATLRTVKINVGFSGNYASVKTFLEQIYKMEMFNNIASFSVTKEEEKSSQPAGEEAKNPEALFAKAEIEFSYLPPVRLERDYTAPIFSRSSFDFTPYEKLTQMITKKAPVLEAGEHGRANPFLP